jgi:hypothetical protein
MAKHALVDRHALVERHLFRRRAPADRAIEKRDELRHVSRRLDGGVRCGRPALHAHVSCLVVASVTAHSRETCACLRRNSSSAKICSSTMWSLGEGAQLRVAGVIILDHHSQAFACRGARARTRRPCWQGRRTVCDSSWVYSAATLGRNRRPSVPAHLAKCSRRVGSPSACCYHRRHARHDRPDIAAPVGSARAG